MSGRIEILQLTTDLRNFAIMTTSPLPSASAMNCWYVITCCSGCRHASDATPVGEKFRLAVHPTVNLAGCRAAPRLLPKASTVPRHPLRIEGKGTAWVQPRTVSVPSIIRQLLLEGLCVDRRRTGQTGTVVYCSTRPAHHWVARGPVNLPPGLIFPGRLGARKAQVLRGQARFEYPHHGVSAKSTGMPAKASEVAGRFTTDHSRWAFDTGSHSLATAGPSPFRQSTFAALHEFNVKHAAPPRPYCTTSCGRTACWLFWTATELGGDTWAGLMPCANHRRILRLP